MRGARCGCFVYGSGLALPGLLSGYSVLDRRQDRLQSDSQRRTLSDFWVAPFRKERLVKLAFASSTRRTVGLYPSGIDRPRPVVATRLVVCVRGFARGPERSRLLVNLDRLPSGSGLPVRRGAVLSHVHSDSYLVDPASSHMLVSKTKPCMSKYKRFLYCETANGSLNQL